MMIKTTAYAIGELAYKLSIVSDEPDLQESYGVTEEVAEGYATTLLAMSNRKETSVSFEKATAAELAMLAGEAEDAAVILRDRARTEVERDGLNRSAREMESLAASIRAQELP